MTSAPNPFATPEARPDQFTPLPVLAQEGSFGLGLTLGIVLGLWGWLGCLIFAKPATKRGAGFGFLARVGITVLIVLIMVALE